MHMGIGNMTVGRNEGPWGGGGHSRTAGYASGLTKRLRQKSTETHPNLAASPAKGVKCE